MLSSLKLYHSINISVVLQLHYKSKVIQKDSVIMRMQSLHQKFRYQLLPPFAILLLIYFIISSSVSCKYIIIVNAPFTSENDSY